MSVTLSVTHSVCHWLCLSVTLSVCLDTSYRSGGPNRILWVSLKLSVGSETMMVSSKMYRPLRQWTFLESVRYVNTSWIKLLSLYKHVVVLSCWFVEWSFYVASISLFELPRRVTKVGQRNSDWRWVTDTDRQTINRQTNKQTDRQTDVCERVCVCMCALLGNTFWSLLYFCLYKWIAMSSAQHSC